MCVEGEGCADVSLTHNLEADAVNYTELSPVRNERGLDATGMLCRRNPLHRQDWRILFVKHPDSAKPYSPLHEGRGLDQDVIGRMQDCRAIQKLVPNSVSRSMPLLGLVQNCRQR